MVCTISVEPLWESIYVGTGTRLKPRSMLCCLMYMICVPEREVGGQTAHEMLHFLKLKEIEKTLCLMVEIILNLVLQDDIKSSRK